MQKTITMPDEWVEPLTRLAAKKGTSLSRLLCEAAAEKLPPSERAKLPPARARGEQRR